MLTKGTQKSNEFLIQTIKNQAPKRSIGFEFEADWRVSNEFKHTHEKCDIVRDLLRKMEAIHQQTIHIDGQSIEVNTQPDDISLFNRGGSKRFNKFMRVYEKKGNPIEAGGTHIHVSKRDDDNKELIKANTDALLSLFGGEFQKLFGRTSHWAPFINEHSSFRPDREIKFPVEMKDDLFMSEATHDGYSKHAMMVIQDSTYEFRMGKSTTSKRDALAWAQLAYNVIELANSTSTKEFKDIPLETFCEGKYIWDYAHNLYGARYIDEETFKSSINTKKYITIITSNKVL